MEIVLAAVVAAGVAVAVALLVQRPRTVGAAARWRARAQAPARADERRVREPVPCSPVRGAGARRAPLGAGSPRGAAAVQGDLARRARGQLDERERSLGDRRNLDHSRDELKEKARQLRELERIVGLSAAQAKQILLRDLEDELRHDGARMIRQIEDETRRDADRRARSILAAVMQRVASGHAVETTVSVVELKSDELKGRIIGREGRNIRTLETMTGIDFIIDDTPGAVLLSGFDGVRREIARLTLERLLQDGRIHPARIEEAYHQARSDIDQHVVEVGEQAVFEANVGSLHPELVKLLGRLKFRTSYGQNVLHHSSSARGSPRCSAPSWGRSQGGGPGGAAARHRQGRVARDRGSARTGRGASSPGDRRRPRRWRTRWRRTTTRWSPRPWRR